MSDKATKLLIFGKTGNGISSTTNTILGENKFQVVAGMVSTTVPFHRQEKSRHGERIKVISVSGMFPAKNTEKEHTFGTEFDRKMVEEDVKVDLTAILLIIRADDRFTDDQYEIYQKMKSWVGDDVMLRKLIVVFTACSDIDESAMESEKLQEILTDAKKRYVCIDNNGIAYKKEMQVYHLLTAVDRLTDPTAPERTPSLCQMIWLFFQPLISLFHRWISKHIDFTGEEEKAQYSINKKSVKTYE